MSGLSETSDSKSDRDSAGNRPIQPQRRSRVMALFAILLALALGPTVGFVYLGQARRGLRWFAAMQAIYLLIVLAVVLQQPWGLWLVLAIGATVGIASLIDLVRVPVLRPRSGGWFLICLGLAVLYIGEPMALRSYVIEAFKVSSGSMIPALQVGDHVYVTKLATVPRRGEIVLFIHPEHPDKAFLKRIMGIGGDTVEFCGSQVRVNGKLLPREQLTGSCSYDDYDEDQGPAAVHKVPCIAVQERNGDQAYVTVHNEVSPAQMASCREWQIPPGQAFVAGDNRDNSHDSRYWGFVPYEKIEGRAWFLWWSSGPDGVRWSRVNQLLHGRPSLPVPPAPLPAP